MSLAASMDLLRARFGADPTRVAEEYAPRYNVAPGEGVVVVTNAAPDVMAVHEWGFVPEWTSAPDGGPTPINARCETVAEKRVFRDAFAQRRCLVLADGFYEWQGTRGGAQPYRICRRDREPLAFAGLWSHWTPDGRVATDGGQPDAASVGPDERWTTTILTTGANPVVEPIHERMPVILEPEDADAWLSGDVDAAHGVLESTPTNQLEAYPVSTRVNDPSNDDPRLFDEVDVATQSGLDDFTA